MQAFNRQEGRMFFLYGYGGTGKMHMWSTLTYALRSQKHIVLTVASSGIASLLLPGGRTTHSKFKIPVPTFDNSVCNIHQGTKLVELLKQTKLIICDEALMTHKFCFEALDKSLCDIMGTTNGSILFGGKVVVFGGDFRQILPMVPRDIKQFYEWILKMGNGKLFEPNDGSAEIDIPEELLIVDYDNPINAICILTCDEKEYMSSDEVDMSDANDNETFNILTYEFLNSLSTSGLPNHKIKLKVGTPIMLLRNLDQYEGLYNGTRLAVTKMTNHVLEAKIMSGKNIGNITYIPRLSMSPSQSPWHFMLIRRQFPIIVSYAMTINKSQGQSLESMGLYLPRPIFSHDQLYVAVSRVQSKKGLKILIHDKDGKATDEQLQYNPEIEKSSKSNRKKENEKKKQGIQGAQCNSKQSIVSEP
ncbi:PREDICTED: ATP-dependent DNA helicase PIF1-like [Lupinus angustifolius]|uniref:ATP-dependent DNA helicase PIF1-like n=1 Tax=Lupinus angustifolius TaxID=3871 RepID=UPI00092F2C79|nr:PREDICTED: ATP-dependent DNA helicase PIF1-like [Lupinus angustifolius]